MYGTARAQGRCHVGSCMLQTQSVNVFSGLRSAATISYASLYRARCDGIQLRSIRNP